MQIQTALCRWAGAYISESQDCLPTFGGPYKIKTQGSLFKIIQGAPGWLSGLSVRQTLDLGSGLDLRVGSSSPPLGSALGVEPIFLKNDSAFQW